MWWIFTLPSQSWIVFSESESFTEPVVHGRHSAQTELSHPPVMELTGIRWSGLSDGEAAALPPQTYLKFSMFITYREVGLLHTAEQAELYWLILGQLTQARVIWKKGTSTEKIPL